MGGTQRLTQVRCLAAERGKPGLLEAEGCVAASPLAHSAASLPCHIPIPCRRLRRLDLSDSVLATTSLMDLMHAWQQGTEQGGGSHTPGPQPLPLEHLDLSRNHLLAGQLPAVLPVAFPNLQARTVAALAASLDLGAVGIARRAAKPAVTAPPFLPAVQHLDLSANSFQGPLPAEWFAPGAPWQK